MYDADAAILIFAKAPVEGQVKTRLIPALGRSGATQLYRHLLHRLVRLLSDARLASIELWCAPNTTHADFQQLKQSHVVTLHSQSGNDLGERMSHAVQDSLSRHRHVVLIGVDCPALSVKLLRQTLDWLVGGTDAVLGPARDGGYVMLGLNRSAECLFEQLPWGTDRVAGLTRQCLQGLGWDWRELPELWDLDRPEDLPELDRLNIDWERV